MLGTGEVPDIVDGASRGSDTAAGIAVRSTFFRTVADSAPMPSIGRRSPCVGAARGCRPTSTTPTRRALLATPRHYAYVKIAEGCDYKCAFCIIPTLRGAYRSRPADSIVREARALAARGVKELLLISQDTTFYGIDRRERGALARLLRELNAVDGLEWIRLLYLYPTTIDDETLAAMAECEKVCKYIDLPLQHASERGAEADEAARHAHDLRPAARRASASACLASRSARPSSSASPARPSADVEELLRFRQRPRVRPRRRVHLLPRGRHVGPRRSPTTCRPGSRPRAAARVMRLQGSWSRRRQRARIGERVRVLVDGPSPRA